MDHLLGPDTENPKERHPALTYFLVRLQELGFRLVYTRTKDVFEEYDLYAGEGESIGQINIILRRPNYRLTKVTFRTSDKHVSLEMIMYTEVCETEDFEDFEEFPPEIKKHVVTVARDTQRYPESKSCFYGDF